MTKVVLLYCNNIKASFRTNTRPLENLLPRVLSTISWKGRKKKIFENNEHTPCHKEKNEERAAIS